MQECLALNFLSVSLIILSGFRYMGRQFLSGHLLQITSKVWGTYHRRVEQCLEETLADLGTDYLDRESFGRGFKVSNRES